MDIQEMSLKQKIGQVCMIGVKGEELQAETVNMLTNYHIGSVLLTEKNMQQPKQVHKITQNLQSYAGKVPLFIATEQGGGEQSSISKGVTQSPDQRTLGQINNRLYTRQIAQVVSEELRAMGVNFNLYPSANIADTESTSFGANNKYTTKHVVAAVQGCNKENVIATVRNFPGTGDQRANITASLSEIGPFYKTALQPFIKAIEAGAQCITITNESVPSTESTEPAVFSSIIVQKLLREKLGFEGIIMTESLEQITNEVSIEEAAIRSLEAGVDLLLLPHDESEQIPIVRAIEDAVVNERISEDQINQAVTRILQVKQAFSVDELVDYDRDQFRKQWSQKLETLLQEKAAVKG